MHAKSRKSLKCKGVGVVFKDYVPFLAIVRRVCEYFEELRLIIFDLYDQWRWYLHRNVDF